jgi:hypothetical protein
LRADEVNKLGRFDAEIQMRTSVWALAELMVRIHSPPAESQRRTDVRPLASRSALIFLLWWSPPSRTDKAPIKEKTPAEEAGFSKIGDRSRGKCDRSPDTWQTAPDRVTRSEERTLTVFASGPVKRRAIGGEMTAILPGSAVREWVEALMQESPAPRDIAKALLAAEADGLIRYQANPRGGHGRAGYVPDLSRWIDNPQTKSEVS